MIAIYNQCWPYCAAVTGRLKTSLYKNEIYTTALMNSRLTGQKVVPIIVVIDYYLKSI